MSKRFRSGRQSVKMSNKKKRKRPTKIGESDEKGVLQLLEVISNSPLEKNGRTLAKLLASAIIKKVII